MSVKSERDRLRRKIEHPGDKLPVGTIAEAAPWLRRPFAPEAVRFKVVEAWADTADGRATKDSPLARATIAPYITAREVVARLNMVCPDMWSEPEYTPQRGEHGPLMWCTLTMTELNIGGIDFVRTVTRRDVGSTFDGKGLVSDALKRAAVKFGVAESLYAVPPIELFIGTEDGVFLRPWHNNGEPWLKLTRAGEEHCRNIYRRWLLAHTGGIHSFGRPLDHGNLTMLGEAEGEGPPMPVLRPDEKSDAPARGRGRQAPQPSGPKVKPMPVVDADAVANDELDKMLALTDGLGSARQVLNAVMLAQGIDNPSERLQAIKDAGDKRGLDAAITRHHQVEKAEQGPVPPEDRS